MDRAASKLLQLQRYNCTDEAGGILKIRWESQTSILYVLYESGKVEFYELSGHRLTIVDQITFPAASEADSPSFMDVTEE